VLAVVARLAHSGGHVAADERLAALVAPVVLQLAQDHVATFEADTAAASAATAVVRELPAGPQCLPAVLRPP